MRKLYNVTKRLSVKVHTTNGSVGDKDGSIVSDNKQQLDRWKGHFDQVMNRPAPEHPIEQNKDPPPQIEIEMGDITDGEIRSAIKWPKINKAPGSDLFRWEF